MQQNWDSFQGNGKWVHFRIMRYGQQQKLKIWQPEEALLRSILGIGGKKASMLLLFAGGFQDITSYRQLNTKAGVSTS